MSLRQDVLDAIQASSILLVFITIFFNISYYKILSILKKEIPEGKLAKQRLINEMNYRILSFSFPVVFINASCFYLFMPLAVRIIKNSTFRFFDFDILLTGFIFIVFGLGIFLFWSLFLLYKSIRKKNSIKKAKST
ncbi:MAG: hypothetical protein U9N62_02795 [Thermotogota bacterium]|nr:hypothetical protein [Thermotogota bacterium]